MPGAQIAASWPSRPFDQGTKATSVGSPLLPPREDLASGIIALTRAQGLPPPERDCMEDRSDQDYQIEHDRLVFNVVEIIL